MQKKLLILCRLEWNIPMSDTNNWTVRMYKAELQGMEQGLTKIKSYGLCTLSAEKLIAKKKKQILKASK